MGTFSTNTTIKVSGAISATGMGTLYTCPANSYAIINIYVDPGASLGSVAVGGCTVFSAISGFGAGSASTTSGPSTSSPGVDTHFQSTSGIYVGPGQSVVAGGGISSASISGVQFTNTP